VHTALCWVLHSEGKVVSPGPQELARLDRRTVLQLCAALLCAAALGTSLSRRTVDGTYVFLEMHPFGQWAWVQDLCDLPLAEAHCRLFRILIDGTCQYASRRGCDQMLVSCTTKPSASATSAIKTCNHVSAMLLEIRPSSKP
jgi:hypothetical protein